MLLSILIPTYNRQHYLIKNLKVLTSIIAKNNLHENVEIIISNNSSSDQTSEKVTEFCATHPDIHISFFDQQQNIGLERNALLVLDKSQAEFVMYLGDDDYLAEQYLTQVVEKLRHSNDISCVVPAYQNIDPDGNPTNGQRDVDFASKIYSAGFENCLQNSFRGHQLSGLTLKREGLLDSYRRNKVNNIYLFIYFVARCCMWGKTWHFTDYPVLVTAAMQKDKDWNYGNDGLLTDMFDNYKKLDEINIIQRSKLEFSILLNQKWRYYMYLRKGKSTFVKTLFNIIKGKNTSWPTKILFPVFTVYDVAGIIARKLLARK